MVNVSSLASVCKETTLTFSKEEFEHLFFYHDKPSDYKKKFSRKITKEWGTLQNESLTNIRSFFEF